MSEPRDSYRILGLAPGASPEEVKDAYIELAKIWHPNLSLDDRLLRRIAEEKMVEIDSAYDELKAFFRSNCYSRLARKKQNAPQGGGRQGMACETPGCSGTVGDGGRCDLCGKPPMSHELRYAIYCPSCGTRNFLKRKKDYDRGVCVQCGVPFRAPVKIRKATTSRKVAYLVLLAVLTAGVWFFFLSSENGTSPRKGRVVSGIPPRPMLTGNASEANGGPQPQLTGNASGTNHEPAMQVTSAPEESTPPGVGAAPSPAPGGDLAKTAPGVGEGSKGAGEDAYQVGGEARVESAGNPGPLERPVSIIPAQPPLTGNASETSHKPPAQIASVPEKKPSPAAAAPFQAAPGSDLARPSAGAGEGSKESVADAGPNLISQHGPASVAVKGGEHPEKSRKDISPAGKIQPKSAEEKSNEKYNELIDYVLKQKSIDSQKSINDLSKAPLNDSDVKHR